MPKAKVVAELMCEGGDVLGYLSVGDEGLEFPFGLFYKVSLESLQFTGGVDSAACGNDFDPLLFEGFCKYSRKIIGVVHTNKYMV